MRKWGNCQSEDILRTTLFNIFLFITKVRNEFYKDTQGAMLVYDVGNRESFEALDSWLEEIRKDIGSAADLEGVVFAVCANKVRSRRETI